MPNPSADAMARQAPPQHNPLVIRHLLNDAPWRDFVATHLPGAVCVRWAPSHRVFHHGERAVKVQRMAALPDDLRLHVKSELALLEALEGRAWSIHPTYAEIDGDWALLAMDWIDGELLDGLLAADRGREVSARSLLAKLIRVSLAGVVHHQFRARHIMRRHDGALFLIDFGGSHKARPLVALWRNLAPLTRVGGRWRPRGVAVIFWRLLVRQKRSASPTKALRVAAVAQRRWQANGNRRPGLRAAGLPAELGAAGATHNLECMEAALHKAIGEDSRLAEETWKVQLASYVLYGNRDWGLFWDRVTAVTDVTGKRVVEIGCGLGPIGVFARIHGSAPVVSLDQAPFLAAARHFAAALGVTGNTYHPLDWQKLAVDHSLLPPGDLVTVLSARADCVPFEQMLDILAQYPEVIYETARPAATASGLAARGFGQVKTIGHSYGDRHFVYGARGA